FSLKEQKWMSEELLKPTRIYVKPVLNLFRDNALRQKRNNVIKGISHITGGAFYDKIARILPDNLSVRINKNSWVVPKIFRLIQNKGNIKEEEMYHTFNMGIGMVLITERESAKFIISRLAEFKLRSWVIGEVVKGRKEVKII
ncbi:MAG: AIR synthase-related protein, partial [Candidatus Omnitrophica bacterium]|nr:AIR synthase-related protein [Candidatus Omnitrophota bacterium]